MVLNWERKVCVLLFASFKSQVLMKVKAHCAWIQTCRSLLRSDSGRYTESCVRSYWFSAAPQLPLQGKEELLSVRVTLLTLRW